MKFNQLKDQLRKKISEKTNSFIRKEYQNEKMKKKKEANALKIIGITGSTGKTTVAVVAHEYLKQLGYKSVLYSSAYVDSPASYIKANEAYEVAVSSSQTLLRIIEEVEAYGAEYLILEINESTIAKGIVKDVDFDMRVLTNLNPKHNLEQYSEDEYVRIKQSFFKNIDATCTCIIGLQDGEKELYEEILNLNKCKKLTFTSQYIATTKGVNPSNITCLLNDITHTTTGLHIGVKID